MLSSEALDAFEQGLDPRLKSDDQWSLVSRCYFDGSGRDVAVVCLDTSLHETEAALQLPPVLLRHSKLPADC